MMRRRSGDGGEKWVGLKCPTEIWKKKQILEKQSRIVSCELEVETNIADNTQKIHSMQPMLLNMTRNYSIASLAGNEILLRDDQQFDRIRPTTDQIA